jgi:hypothetical protein
MAIRDCFVQLVFPRRHLDALRSSSGGAGNFPFQFDACDLVVHCAATGDQGFDWRRRAIAFPLLKENIASAIIEVPFYGCRRCEQWESTSFPTIFDFYLMGRGTVEEGRSLLHFFGRERQFRGRLGVTGISMGGAMASVIGVSRFSERERERERENHRSSYLSLISEIE